jgi:hypothetical protein
MDLQQKHCLSELWIMPPHISTNFPTLTNPIVLPNLTSPLGPRCQQGWWQKHASGPT